MEVVVEKNYRDKETNIKQRHQLRNQRSEVNQTVKKEETENRNSRSQRSRQRPKRKSQTKKKKKENGKRAKPGAGLRAWPARASRPCQ
jgi:hypothetical protein